MLSRLLLPLALAALAAIGAVTPAAACCACAVPCAPPVVVPQQPVYVTPFYIVDQGPVYGGPHIVTTPRFEPFHVPPSHYPRMRQTYYYPTYRDSYLLPPWHKPWHQGRW